VINIRFDIWRAITGWPGPPLASSDELIGNIVQVITDDLWLRTDP
jgi:hypothetical protein